MLANWVGSVLPFGVTPPEVIRHPNTCGQFTLIGTGPALLLPCWAAASLLAATWAELLITGQFAVVGVVVRVTVRLKLDNAAIESAVQWRFCPLKGKQVRLATVPDEVGPVMLQPVPGSVSSRTTLRAVLGPLLTTVTV